MAKREFYANWKVEHGEGQGRTIILPGKTGVLDDTDPAVKRLVERGALTPVPEKAQNSGQGAGTGKDGK